jgi:hypothetical protein
MNVTVQLWDAKPVEFPTYHAPQRACQDASLLQMMQIGGVGGCSLSLHKVSLDCAIYLG